MGGDWEPKKDLIGKPGGQKRQTLNRKINNPPNTKYLKPKTKMERKALVIKTF